MTGFKIDATELRTLSADMRQMPEQLHHQTAAALHTSALAIKKDLRAKMAASKHFKGVARGISYDVRSAGFGVTGVLEAEIGPTKGSPGSLANIAYFGSSRGGGTVEDPQAALDREAPNFEKELADLIGEWI